MCHTHLAGALGEPMEMGHTASGAARVLQHPPETFERMKRVATRGREEVEAACAVVVVEGRVKLVRPLAPAPIDDHPPLLRGVPAGCHHGMDLLAQLLGITVRHDFLADVCAPLLDGSHDAQSPTPGDAAP
jgi:hypothetical protein